MISLEKPFARMGARVKVLPNQGPWRRADLTLDVRRDGDGEYFSVAINEGKVDLTVLQVEPKDRHLLLMSRDENGKHRFLLGHDERHWFVAAIPESTPVSTVEAAKAALKPSEVLMAESGLKQKHRNRRHNASRIRQGEWFFVPAPSYREDPKLVLKNEPLVRSRGGKPHMCSELFRVGGETVYVSRSAPDGLDQAQYDAMNEKDRRMRAPWQVMKRNPTVYVRGKVRHSDHATIELGGWHRVFSNTETLSYAMRSVVFLD